MGWPGRLGMRTKYLSICLAIGAVGAGTLQAPTRAGDPSADELVALAPLIDSSDARCKSLDVGGWLGSDEPLAPKWRFRALYRAPDQSCMLITDASDGTPLGFGSGRKMFIYDPIGPNLYYSEAAGFNLKMLCTTTGIKMKFNYLVNCKTAQHILLDFRSIMSLTGHASDGRAVDDTVVKRTASNFELLREFKNEPYLSLRIDLSKEYPYTGAAFFWNGKTYLCVDRLTVNAALKDEVFLFPAKRRFPRALPVKVVRADEGTAAIREMETVFERAGVVRAVINRAGPPEAINIPGFSTADWERVRANDRKFAKTLKGLVPASLREP
jgi:hypothetical protein